MKKVLVVDDSVTMRELVASVLRRMGLSVEKASNGKEALELLKKENFDLVISDVNMPVMGGLELLKEFRKINKRTPFLILTTETELSKKEEAKKHGATGWIVKPFREAKLKEVVKRVLRLD